MSADSGPWPLYSLGYGSRTREEMLHLLLEFGIGVLVDIRSQPYSRFKPEFGYPALQRWLPEAGIQYVYLGNLLGGRPDDVTCYTDGKVDYAKVREQPFFQDGIARLVALHGGPRPIAMMCSEGKPESCHRARLVAPAVQAAGIPTVHLDEQGTAQPHDQVMAALTGFQPALFDEPAAAARSRKRYRERD